MPVFPSAEDYSTFQEHAHPLAGGKNTSLEHSIDSLREITAQLPADASPDSKDPKLHPVPESDASTIRSVDLTVAGSDTYSCRRRHVFGTPTSRQSSSWSLPQSGKDSTDHRQEGLADCGMSAIRSESIVKATKVKRSSYFSFFGWHVTEDDEEKDSLAGDGDKGQNVTDTGRNKAVKVSGDWSKMDGGGSRAGSGGESELLYKIRSLESKKDNNSSSSSLSSRHIVFDCQIRKKDFRDSSESSGEAPSSPILPKTPYPSPAPEVGFEVESGGEGQGDGKDEAFERPIILPRNKSVRIKDEPISATDSRVSEKSEPPKNAEKGPASKFFDAAARTVRVRRFFNVIQRRLHKSKNSRSKADAGELSPQRKSPNKPPAAHTPSRQSVSPSLNERGDAKKQLSTRSTSGILSPESPNTLAEYLPQGGSLSMIGHPTPLLIPGSSKDFLPSEAQYVYTPDDTPVTEKNPLFPKVQETMSEALGGLPIPTRTNSQSHDIARGVLPHENKSILIQRPSLSQGHHISDVAPFIKMGDTFPSPPTPPMKGYKKHKKPNSPPLDTHGLLDNDKSRGERIMEFISRGSSPVPWLSRPSSPTPVLQRAERKTRRTNISAFKKQNVLVRSNTEVGAVDTSVDYGSRGISRAQVDGGKSEKTAGKTGSSAASTASSSLLEQTKKTYKPPTPMFKVLPLLPLEPEDWRRGGKDSELDWATGLC